MFIFDGLGLSLLPVCPFRDSIPLSRLCPLHGGDLAQWNKDCVCILAVHPRGTSFHGWYLCLNEKRSCKVQGAGRELAIIK